MMGLSTLKGNHYALPNRLCTMKVNSMLFDIGVVFGWIPLKVHLLNIRYVYTQINDRICAADLQNINH